MSSFIKKIRFQHAYKRWLKKGSPPPPSKRIKQYIIEQYQQQNNCQTFIETGTFRGDMITAQLDNFERLYSIELSDELYNAAKQAFANQNKVHLLQGDSGIRLIEVLNDIIGVPLFWLDGHYSGGVTALADKECPVDEELATIIASSLDQFVLLIDDARMFVGEQGYSTIDEIKSIINKAYPKASFDVKDDIIRIVQLT
ncbi:MAG TPA: hypothetical protein DD827_06945 [Gammaproteobacteria bacterium]|jgi:hypothetical protein|nr:hypothetical protein [Gammaproteobacteria bacterium]